jgi:hypothetical protein
MKYSQYLNEAQNDDTQAWLQYQSKAKDINNKLKDIEGKLKKHYARAKSQKTNWGFAGDLTHVYDLLFEISDFLKN